VTRVRVEAIHSGQLGRGGAMGERWHGSPSAPTACVTEKKKVGEKMRPTGGAHKAVSQGSGRL
jgi:hypothetical protein